MSKKSKVIICLLAIAVILFCIIQFWAVPAKQAKQEEYALNQADALTHDISAIEDFKSPYVGDASNVANLFYSLPLWDISMKFQVNSETCALTVNYLDTVWNIGEEKVQRDLIYNSVAAMAAIDNLSEITYEFSGDAYSFDREQVEAVFGTPLSDLLADKDTWNEKVQNQLKSADFVAQFYSEMTENLTATHETQVFLDAFLNNTYAIKFIPYTGSPVDMDTAEFQETVVMGSNAANSMSSLNGKNTRILVRGDEQKVFMIDDEQQIYYVNSTDNVLSVQYADFEYVQSGTENLNQTECVFDTYIGKQVINDSEAAISLTVYLRADDHTIYAIKTERETSTEIMLIKEMRTTVEASELECPRDYEEVDSDTFYQSLY